MSVKTPSTCAGYGGKVLWNVPAGVFNVSLKRNTLPISVSPKLPSGCPVALSV